ncbi:RecX family transcriptional regulator [Paenibacillus sp. F411]|uniref:regulatory protein RecX n=1 Tax=Paenibacillus sp. F411 TaxID=2820239 RepID=UPI001AAF89C1|nr:RecX family transcriptional regulator [Paenibacillus sp. F411]MBO2944147.1 RecX family transcriptional regulator [Paenibacillus sp. F411]
MHRYQQEQQLEGTDLSDFPEGEDLIITAVEALRKPRHRYLIWFGPYSMSVHEDVMIKYVMTKDAVFHKAELLDIVMADEEQRAYVESLKFLERKPRTAKEIQQRLMQKGMTEDAIQKSLQRLSQEGLIDDAWYAKQWAEQRISGHKKGKMWVKQELKQKGIDSEIITEALDEVDEEAELESCYIIGRKKWQQSKGEIFERKRKTGAFLMRRGFTGDQVRKTVNRLVQEEGQDEELEDESFH